MKQIFFAAILCSFGSKAVSQVINIENKRFLKDTNGLVGKTDLNLSINQNIQQVIQSGTNVHAQYRKNRHRLLAITDLSFIKAGETDFVNAGYQHLRYSYKLSRLITWEFFVQAQYNRILLLDKRYLAGSGPRFKIVKREHLKLYAAGLYMYEYQCQNKETIEQYNHRLSFYLTFTIDYKKLDVTSTIFYQPKIDEPANYRIANDSSFDVEITSHLYYKTGFNLLYDTRQPPGIPSLTYILRNGISYRF